MKFLALKITGISLFLLVFFNQTGFSQEEPGADSLFTLARKEAFDKKNYPQAVILLKEALKKSPDYADLHLFLGRIYTWTDKPDSARQQFNLVLKNDAHNEEALNGLYDLEYWDENYSQALKQADFGLKSYPESENFAMRKAKALNALKRPAEALKVTHDFLINHPQNYRVSELQHDIRLENLTNRLSAGYNFVYFDKRFDQPWNYANISYGFETRKIGSYTISANYANRFDTNGLEIEADTYPNITDGLYAYVGGAVSGSSIFPKYRLGFSLYKRLPKSFEAEGGLRYLQFSSSTTVYVAGLGRYVGNSFIGIRSFLTPSDGRLSQSFNLSWKYLFTDDRNDFFNFTVGTGISPDDRARQILIQRKLKSFKIASDYSTHISPTTIISVSGSWINEEYSTNTFGNEFSVSVGLQQRF